MPAAIPSALAAPSAAAPPAAKPKNAVAAAKQFEAMLIAQMLRTTREASGQDGEDSTSSTMLDMADQQLAQTISAHGGFGLSAMIAKSLSKK